MGKEIFPFPGEGVGGWGVWAISNLLNAKWYEKRLRIDCHVVSFYYTTRNDGAKLFFINDIIEIVKQPLNEKNKSA